MKFELCIPDYKLPSDSESLTALELAGGAPLWQAVARQPRIPASNLWRELKIDTSLYNMKSMTNTNYFDA